MVQPISGTINSLFTSIIIAMDLLKYHKPTVVGLVRTTKRDVPQTFLSTKSTLRPLLKKNFNKKRGRKKKTKRKFVAPYLGFMKKI